MEQIEAFDKITLTYNPGPIPPPFCHQYKISIEKSTSNEFLTDLSLEYYNRDEITEEEIFDEGFSMDDNCTWSGTLPLLWGKMIESKLKSTNWVCLSF